VFVVGVLGVVLPEARDALIILPVSPPSTQIILELVAVGIPLYYLHCISSVRNPILFDLRWLSWFRYGLIVGAETAKLIDQPAEPLGNRSVDFRDTRRY
jgi:hypothetical protein